jgi:protein-disulfide isomerase
MKASPTPLGADFPEFERIRPVQLPLNRSLLSPASVRDWLLLVVLLVAAGACNQPGKAKEPPASPTACADYAKKVCTEAGEQSTTCSSIKEATGLMPAAACAAANADFATTKAKLAEAHKACDDLSAKLCKDIGEQTETCDMVKTQTKTFPAERCAMMNQHYAEVLGDLKKREARNAPLPADKVAEISKPDAPNFGPDSSTVTIVEFSDFQCPFCSRAANVVQQLKGKYGDKVHFVFRQFPLSFHKQAHLAAEAALAAHAQGKFWQYHDKLFADQSKLDRPSLEATAKEVGLDVNTFKKALDTNQYASAVDADQKLGESVNVDGTPTMFLNGARVSDPTNFEALSKQIDTALAGGGEKKPG